MRLIESQVGLAILGRLAFHPLLFAWRQFCPQLIRDLLGEIGLNREHIRELTIVIFRPHVLVILCVNQLHVDAHAVANAANAAFQNGTNT